MREVMWSSSGDRRVRGMCWIEVVEVVEWVSSGWMNSGGILDRIRFFLERARDCHDGGVEAVVGSMM